MRGCDSRSDGILAYLCMSAAKQCSTTFLFQKPAGITCLVEGMENTPVGGFALCILMHVNAEGVMCGFVQLSPGRKVD